MLREFEVETERRTQIVDVTDRVREVYQVDENLDGLCLLGYRLTKADGTVYDIDATEPHWRCDCPDAEWRPDRDGGCKHRRALAALTSAGKL